MRPTLSPSPASGSGPAPSGPGRGHLRGCRPGDDRLRAAGCAAKHPQAFPSRLARYAVLSVKAGRIAGAQIEAAMRCPDWPSSTGLRVESLDAAARQNGEGWESVLVENWTVTPADLAASRIDFREWLGRMKRRRREIAESLAAGYRTEEVAELFRLSPVERRRCGGSSRTPGGNTSGKFHRNVGDRTPTECPAA